MFERRVGDSHRQSAGFTLHLGLRSYAFPSERSSAQIAPVADVRPRLGHRRPDHGAADRAPNAVGGGDPDQRGGGGRRLEGRAGRRRGRAHAGHGAGLDQVQRAGRAERRHERVGDGLSRQRGVRHKPGHTVSQPDRALRARKRHRHAGVRVPAQPQHRALRRRSTRRSEHPHHRRRHHNPKRQNEDHGRSGPRRARSPGVEPAQQRAVGDVRQRPRAPRRNECLHAQPPVQRNPGRARAEARRRLGPRGHGAGA